MVMVMGNLETNFPSSIALSVETTKTRGQLLKYVVLVKNNDHKFINYS